MEREFSLMTSLRTGLLAVPQVRKAVNCIRELADPDRRAIARMRRTHAKALLQPWPTTFEDRYPEIFTALDAHLWTIANPRILSFGCSDGSEVRSLRRWFPNARIVGLDPNPAMIRTARAHLALHPDPAISYIEAADVAALGDQKFDAILAMAVFRHGNLEREDRETCSALLPFSRFAETVAELDRHLVPGGWLTIWNAQFRFCDTPVAERYEARTLRFTRAEPMTLLYGPDDKRIEGSYSEAMFLKRE
jgi:hypothetical protein